MKLLLNEEICRMQRLKDIVRQGSDPEIRGNFANIANRLEGCAGHIQIEPFNDYVGLVSQRLLKSAAREVRAAASQYRKDIFAFAWRVRNIFECMLILKRVASGVDQAAAYAAQKGSDERSILDGLISLADGSTADTTLLEQRSQHISKTLAKSGFDRASPWRMDVVAQQVGMKSEYDAFYKLYSKYVHPSSWNVLADPDEYEAPPYWQIFLIQGQLHALHIITTAEGVMYARSSGQRDA
jgi:hypothetical protein